MTLLTLYFHTVVPFIQLPRRSVSTLAIRESVLRENSCNPVVRAASTSTLSIASRQNPFMVESIRRRLVSRAWLLYVVMREHNGIECSSLQ